LPIRDSGEAEYNCRVRALWKKIRHRYEWIGLVLATKIVPLLPRKTCFHLANAFGGLVARLDFAGRKVARSNLEIAFGDTLLSSQREEIAVLSYRHLGRTMVDLLWSPRLTQENFHRWFAIEGLRETMAEIDPKQGCIFVTIHYGNFEWAAKAMGLCGLPLLILAQEFKNPLLDPIIAGLRKDFGHEIAPREGAMVRMYKALRRGKHVAILSDLTLRPTEPSVAIECFELKTCVTYAHAWLHQKTGAPMIPLHCEQLPNGRCRLVVQRKLEISRDATETEITQACWDRFEPLIRKNAAPWFWMYKQWRYKPSQTDRVYPFYANTSYYFDQMLMRSVEEMKDIRASYAAPALSST
jgi:KDO2-lipid IV(A) lauroyltransferase